MSVTILSSTIFLYMVLFTSYLIMNSPSFHFLSSFLFPLTNLFLSYLIFCFPFPPLFLFPIKRSTVDTLLQLHDYSKLSSWIYLYQIPPRSLPDCSRCTYFLSSLELSGNNLGVDLCGSFFGYSDVWKSSTSTSHDSNFSGRILKNEWWLSEIFVLEEKNEK